MSSDNGIYVLQSKDGYRVTEAQAIENLYWHPIKYCNNQQIFTTEDKEGFSIELCKNCGSKIEWEQRDYLNPEMLLNYFGNCKVFKTKDEILKQAMKIDYKMAKEGLWTEYGINFIFGWEDKEFPK